MTTRHGLRNAPIAALIEKAENIWGDSPDAFDMMHKLKDALVELLDVPSVSDREALREAIMSVPMQGTRAKAYEIADAVLEAGFRRSPHPVQVGITDTESIVASAMAKSDDENHEQLCACDLWPESCVTYGETRPWSHDAEFVARAALSAALGGGD